MPPPLLAGCSLLGVTLLHRGAQSKPPGKAVVLVARHSCPDCVLRDDWELPKLENS